MFARSDASEVDGMYERLEMYTEAIVQEGKDEQ